MPRARAIDAFLKHLSSRFGERIRTDAEALETVARDESGLPGCPPAALVQPESVDEIVLVAKEAYNRGVPMVPRGAGTGKAGGCIPRREDVVVDLSRMSSIIELRPKDMYARVQPGVITESFHEAVSEEGFFYPPDPGSLESCTLGGNIATNAGGPRAVKYGSTQRYVWGLQAVLPSGELVRMGRRSIKGVAGFDLTALMVGSEGTLGFVAEATLHVVPAPAAVETAWLTFDSIRAASRAAEQIFAAGLLPRMMEVMDATALGAVRPVADFLFPESAGTALLIEADGAVEQAKADLLRMAEIATDAGAVDSALAQKEKDRKAMRRTRRLVSSSLKESYPFKLSDDIAVPRSVMTELLDKAAEIAGEAGLPLTAYGHLGDGNLHVNLLCKTDAERQLAMPVRQRILAQTVGLGGTVSGEHGIGLAKRDELLLEQAPVLIDLQRRLRKVFDPRGLMNPGKVIAAERGHDIEQG